jgi:death-on-curing protein
MAPLFLNLEHVLRIHRSMIERYGGQAGVRDAALLQSAIAMPQASFGGDYLHADIIEMAAAYLFHIVSNHPFLDGNKRAGAAAAVVFLAMNDISLRADEDGLVDITLRVASGRASKKDAAAFPRTMVDEPQAPAPQT